MSIHADAFKRKSANGASVYALSTTGATRTAAQYLAEREHAADIVGGPYWPTLIDVIERGGRYTCSGAIAGPMVDLDLRTLYLRDLTFAGSTVISPQVTKTLVSYIETQQIKPALAATYTLADLHAAQTAFIEKKHTGNIVVTPW